MADTLLIHYSPTMPDQAVWSIANNEGELTTKLTYGSLSDATAFSDNYRTVMLLDSNFIHLNQVTLPTKNKTKLLHAVPFALEEQLADEIEDLHFVIAETPDKKQTAVACIAKKLLSSILSDCADAGLKIDAIVPDALCLTADSNQWAILLFNDTAYIHQDSLTSTCIDREYYKEFLAHQFKTDDVPTPKKLFIFQNQDGELEKLETGTFNETEIIPVTFNDHPIVLFCGHYQNAMPLNLLQHEYKPVSKNNISFQRWGIAASLALFWLIIHLGSISFQNSQLETANNKLRAEIIKTYKKSFPKSKKIVNPRVQMEQKLNALRLGSNSSNTDLLSLLGDVHTPFSSNKDITINNINYKNERIDITLTSDNLKAVELVNKNLNTKTLTSEIISSSSENNIVKGNIRIQRPKS